MKKYVLLLAALSLYLSSYSQTSSGEKVIGVHTGFSLTGVTFKGVGSLLSDSSNGQYEFSNLPAIAFSFDYGVSDQFSLGLLVSSQQFKGNIRGRTFRGLDDSLRIESFDFQLNRIYIGLSSKYHWPNQNEQLDLYSGLRGGFVFWSNEINTQDPFFDVLEEFSGGRPTLAVVPIGGNYYFTDSFGANFELALGAPHVVSLGLQLKL
ncbi:MAG: hypothetical protein ACPGTP_06240 [Bacteroidia bacterium]